MLEEFLDILIEDAEAFVGHTGNKIENTTTGNNTKTVSAMDVVKVLKKNGRVLYGFGG